ncbi:tyrosine-type recombinase/integrase [Luminiphilus sp.]|nr:tyrosine-type recombinase/integrase [Luminiphilus sp.]
MIDEIFEKFDGAFAENTMRAYRSDFEQYSKWCETKNISPIPATADNLAMYVDDLSHTCKSATIRRRVNSLGTIFTLSKNPDPSKDPEVVLALKRMHRSIGRHQKQATPLTRDQLERLLSNCSNDLRGLRNRVLLQLGYETMRRRSELCAFRFEDLEVRNNVKPILHLRKSKADQESIGRPIPISHELANLIETWREKIGVNSGFILRAVNKHGAASSKLSPGSIPLILNCLRRTTTDSSEGTVLSGHSFRVGAALDLLHKGETLERIMIKGGWKSHDSAVRYLQQINY